MTKRTYKKIDPLITELHELFERSGETILELSRRSKFDRRQIYNVFSGAHSPTIRTYRILRNAIREVKK